MDIETNSAIKLFFPNPSLTLVYFEALANSFDAGATKVEISIEIESFSLPSSLRISIADNGTGFTDASFARFEKLMKPKDKFHKGIGRLVFLNYFKRVEVSSYWGEAEATKHRSFIFEENFKGENKTSEHPRGIPNSTNLVFSGFAKEKVKSYDDLRPDALKELIIEHLLPRLNELRENNVDFEILLGLKTSESNEQKDFFPHQTKITATDLPELKTKELKSNFIDAHSSIKMHYHIKSPSKKSGIFTAFSIDGRTVPFNLVQPSAIPPGHFAVIIFTSDIFGISSDNSRQKLEISENIDAARLYSFLRKEAGAILNAEIPTISQSNNRAKQQLENQFPHLLGYFEENTVGLLNKDDAINIAQEQFFRDQKQILQCEHLSDADYEKSLNVSARTLTEYILYREKIIAKLRDMNEENSEKEIHNLIVPRYKEFKGGSLASEAYQNNAWLLDDKFMSFRTILSESRMDRVIDAVRLTEGADAEDSRPDIAMIFSGDPEAQQAVDVVIVELKKKTDEEKENLYAITQLLQRAEKLVAHCPNIQRIWYYAVLQINDSLSTRLKQMRWTPLFSKGQLYYQEQDTFKPDGSRVPTPVFVMSFDAIVSDAATRNHAFLEILRAAMRKQAQIQDFPASPH